MDEFWTLRLQPGAITCPGNLDPYVYASAAIVDRLDAANPRQLVLDPFHIGQQKADAVMRHSSPVGALRVQQPLQHNADSECNNEMSYELRIHGAQRAF